ncbi:hypothetical protein [Spirosoma linguale]|uniref:Uncharacterized protein n=1 Tax=Spirosoma linguale (strain ATCC 33905 / DSM 74 / LMG 10896 / Claus 1) TaxID=504472 RepID=D2QQ50_SPILD|nr:hypothetical protein Slin_3475 [Spirosoma linguale DSM 74]
MISSEKLITEKEGYEAMLYMLRYYYELTGETDLTDILSGGEYITENNPGDPAFWYYWLDAIEKVRQEGPPSLKKFYKP